MRVRFLLALPILCLLLGCGAGGGCEPSTEVFLDVVSPHEVDPDYNPFDPSLPRGWTSWSCGEPTHVWLLDFLEEEDRFEILCHELWHVAGFHDHLTDPACVACAPEGQAVPCPQEVDAVRSVGRTFRLHPSPDVWEVTVRAADWWNDALGTVTFRIE